MPKYIKIKGKKIKLKTWNTFLRKIKQIDKDNGSRISAKLFSILVDKLLNKRAPRRRNTQTSTKKGQTFIQYPAAGVTSGIKSDTTLVNDAVAKLKRKQELEAHANTSTCE